MRTVLVIAYYFPPEGGPAVQRTVKFVKYLNEYGYKSIVLTANHFAKTKDDSLLEDIPRNTKIIRLFDFGVLIPNLLKKILLGKKYVDKHQFWNYVLKFTAGRIINKNKIDIIFSTTPPHSINIGASYLSQKYNIPWVADFRDEWTNDPNFGKQKNRDSIRDIEKSTISIATAITTVTRKGKNNFAEIVQNRIKTYCIYNGFDKDDYRQIQKHEFRERKKLSIIYTGRLTKKSSPKYFFSILQNIYQSDEIKSDEIEINIVGPEGNKKWVDNFDDIKPNVNFIGYQPHNVSAQMLADSDVLMLFATNSIKSEVFTGKLFEYFYFQKPILAIIRYEGELSKLISNYGNAYIGIESIPGSVKTAFLKLFNDWKDDKLSKEINAEFLNSFDRKILAQNLSEVFNKVLQENTK